MSIDMNGRSFLTLMDYSKEEIYALLELAHILKMNKHAGKRTEFLKGKNICLLFDKTSTRTRCAFEVACHDEGGHTTFLTNSQMSKKESIEDTAKVLGGFYDGIEYRGHGQEIVEKLARYAGVPVWNGLTDEDHPTQVLATFLTLQEHVKKPLQQIKLVYVGDARNNVANALMMGCAKLGMHYVGLAPESLFPAPALMEQLNKIAKLSGAKLEISADPDVVKGADAIYTDVWVSMGEEALLAERIELLLPYQVNQALLDRTGNPDVKFMHCLPAYHDTETEMGQLVYEQFGLTAMEVTDQVFRSPNSLVFQEAENRMHTIKAVMVATLGNVALPLSTPTFNVV